VHDAILLPLVSPSPVAFVEVQRFFARQDGYLIYIAILNNLAEGNRLAGCLSNPTGSAYPQSRLPYRRHEGFP
jgi:hypothetical protein